MNQRGPSDYWRLTGSAAELSHGPLQAAIDIQRPHRGLHSLRIHDSDVDGSWLGVDVGSSDPAVRPNSSAPPVAWQPSDAYVRGRDLVVMYREPASQPFNVQLYWRVVEATHPLPLTIDVIVSVQTPLWEAYPAIVLQSTLPGATVAATPDSLLYHAGADWSYGEVSLPGDFALSEASASTLASYSRSWQFGPVFMERGVIRRLRLRGGLMPTSQADVAIHELRADLLAEQPPLTA